MHHFLSAPRALQSIIVYLGSVGYLGLDYPSQFFIRAGEPFLLLFLKLFSAH